MIPDILRTFGGDLMAMLKKEHAANLAFIWKEKAVNFDFSFFFHFELKNIWWLHHSNASLYV
jgi:hypothetical protein